MRFIVEIPKRRERNREKERVSEEKNNSVEKETKEENNQDLKKENGFAIMLQNLALYSIFRKLLLTSIFCAVCLIITVVGVFSYTTESNEPRYLPTSEKGEVIRDYPLNEKGLVEDGDVGSNAIETIKILNTYDYINWRKQIVNAEKYFRGYSWAEYQKSFSDSKTLKTVEDEKSIINVEVVGEVDIKNKLQEGSYFWRVLVPITVKYYPHKENVRAGYLTQNLDVEIVYVRVPLSENPRQFAIHSYRASERLKK